MNELLARLRSYAGTLAPRERLLLGAALAALGLTLFYLAVARPVLAARANAATRVATAEQELEAMQRLRREFDEVNGRLSSVETRIQQGPRGNIFTTLETLAQQAAIKVDSMEPQTSPASDRYRETKVQVVLKAVSLSQMVQYLQGIESAPQVLSVKSLRVRTRQDKPEMLDVTFTVSSFEPVQG